MGAAIRGRLVGRLGLFLASLQVTGSSGCTADYAGPDPARQNSDHREVAADTAVVHPHVADLVDDDGHLTGAYVRGPRLVRHSEVLGVLHEPGSAQAGAAAETTKRESAETNETYWLRSTRGSAGPDGRARSSRIR